MADGQSESAVTVIIAFAANAAIAIAKSVAALLTGSASMTAEAAHSWADTGNEVFLFIAEKRGNRPPDARHPLGFGRDAYVWSLFAAFGLFTVGAVVSVSHGITELGTSGPAEYPLVAYLVLAISFVLEGASFFRAFGQIRGTASSQQRRIVDFTLHTSDPTVRAVVFEDAAALVGIVIAAVGIGLHQLTGNGVFDAMGSILVGVVLGLVALVLIQQNRKFLIGEAGDDAVRARVLKDLQEQPEILRVTYLHIEFVGPARVYLVAAVDLMGDAPESDVAERLRALDHRLETNPAVVRAVLTLSTRDDETLTLE